MLVSLVQIRHNFAMWIPSRFSRPLVLFLLIGCSSSNDTSGRIQSPEAAATSELPPIKVKLPPPPAFDRPHPPEAYGDGAYSVFGLRKNRAKLLNTEVSLTAMVREVYQCKCKANDKSCRCAKPHFFVVDPEKRRNDDGMLVVDYPAAVGRAGLLKAGQTLHISGNYVSASASGFSASDGLVVATKVGKGAP